jgi:hypothetical protein
LEIAGFGRLQPWLMRAGTHPEIPACDPYRVEGAFRAREGDPVPFWLAIFEYAEGQAPTKGTIVIASTDPAIIAGAADAFSRKLKGRTPSAILALGSHPPLAVVKPPPPAGKPAAKPAAPDAPAAAAITVEPLSPDAPARS